MYNNKVKYLAILELRVLKSRVMNSSVNKRLNVSARLLRNRGSNKLTVTIELINDEPPELIRKTLGITINHSSSWTYALSELIRANVDQYFSYVLSQ